MKANELRIGNKLLFIDYPAQEIRTINGNDIAYAEREPNWLDGFFKPIPLTEEWLLKFGFKEKEMYSWKGNGADWQPETNKTECRDFVLNDDFFVRYEKWGYVPNGKKEFIWDIKFKIFCSIWYERCTEYQALFNKCEYVHQLQNLYFALTGEELVYNEI